MPKVYKKDNTGDIIVASNEAKEIILNKANSLYEGSNLDDVLVEIANKNKELTNIKKELDYITSSIKNLNDLVHSKFESDVKNLNDKIENKAPKKHEHDLENKTYSQEAIEDKLRGEQKELFTFEFLSATNFDNKASKPIEVDGFIYYIDSSTYLLKKYNIDTNTATNLTTPTGFPNRFYFNTFYDSVQKNIYFVGGYNSSGTKLSTVFIYNIPNNTFSTIPNFPITNCSGIYSGTVHNGRLVLLYALDSGVSPGVYKTLVYENGIWTEINNSFLTIDFTKLSTYRFKKIDNEVIAYLDYNDTTKDCTYYFINTRDFSHTSESFNLLKYTSIEEEVSFSIRILTKNILAIEVIPTKNINFDKYFIFYDINTMKCQILNNTKYFKNNNYLGLFKSGKYFDDSRTRNVIYTSAISGNAIDTAFMKFTFKDLYNPLYDKKEYIELQNKSIIEKVTENTTDITNLNTNVTKNISDISTMNTKVTKLTDSHYSKYTATSKAQLWLGIQEIWDMGYTGKGVNVAFIEGTCSNLPDIPLAGGWDALNNKPLVVSECIGKHGTGVSSCIKSVRFGTAPDCNLYFVRSGNLVTDNRITMDSVIMAVQWCIDNKIKIINISLAFFGYQEYPEFKAIFDKAEANGLIVLVCSGNEDMNIENKQYLVPSNYSSVINIGMISYNNDNMEVIPYAQFLTIGRNVPIYDFNGSACVSDGSSFATPLIAGLSACIIQKYPNLTTKELRALFQEYCYDIGLPARGTNYKYGIIKAFMPSFQGYKREGLLLENKPKNIYFKYRNLEIMQGISYNTGLIVLPKTASKQYIKYEIDNTTFLEVTNDGKFLGKELGSTTVVAIDEDSNLISSCDVKVVPNPNAIVLESISVTPSASVLYSDEEIAYNVTLTPANVTSKLLTYSTSDKSIATIDSLGEITIVGTGSVTITITHPTSNKSCNFTFLSRQRTTFQHLDALNVKPLHDAGIKGDGVTVAIIGRGITQINGNEFNIIEYKNYGGSSEVNTYFPPVVGDQGLDHSIDCISSLASKTMGIAPNAKLRQYRICSFSPPMEILSAQINALNYVNSLTEVPDILILEMHVPSLDTYLATIESLINKGCIVIVNNINGNNGVFTQRVLGSKIIITNGINYSKTVFTGYLSNPVDFCCYGSPTKSLSNSGTIIDGYSVLESAYFNFYGRKATYLVAGIIALLKQQDPTLNTDKLISLLPTLCEDVGGVGYDNNYGHGILKPKIL